VHQFGDSSNDSEVDSHNCARRQGVNHAAFENQIHVHQPVTEDGVAKG
jgi:hypothetical protein